MRQTPNEMKLLKELIDEFGGLSGGTIETHIYDYFEKYLGDTVASYEIDRINLVAVTLERDELDEEIKRLGTERKKIIEKNASLSIQNALSQSKLKEAEERATHWYDLYTQQLKRKDQLEEWLIEHRDQLKKENVYHKNQGIINAINELLNEL